MDRPHPSRRAILATGAILAGAAATRAKAGAPDRALTLFDPSEPAARKFAMARSGRKAALAGDRIRLARRLLSSHAAPDRLTVVGRHADVLLLTEAAREQGYRTLAEGPFPAPGGGLFIWSAQRRV